ncbi:diguanylate kinase signaling protein [Clostridioides difficile]|nr:diguanylate kinase signaling protein [Clostridioides difficile]
MNKHNFEVILNQLQINIYVTNIYTNEIIFMNKK